MGPGIFEPPWMLVLGQNQPLEPDEQADGKKRSHILANHDDSQERLNCFPVSHQEIEFPDMALIIPCSVSREVRLSK